MNPSRDFFLWDPREAIRYRHVLKPYCPDSTFPCGHCGKPYNEHGWIPVGEGPTMTGHLVCPGMCVFQKEDGSYGCERH